MAAMNYHIVHQEMCVCVCIYVYIIHTHILIDTAGIHTHIYVKIYVSLLYRHNCICLYGEPEKERKTNEAKC